MSSESRKTNRILIAGGIIAIVVILGVLVRNQSSLTTSGSLAGMTATVYRSATCGCCANYVNYLRRAGIKVDEKIEPDMSGIKNQFGIPGSLNSCHTTQIGGYTVEGHIPIEAIDKLIAEKPKIAGIGMGGMPSGSPGMPGAKVAPFDINSFGADGSVASFMSL